MTETTRSLDAEVDHGNPRAKSVNQRLMRMVFRNKKRATSRDTKAPRRLPVLKVIMASLAGELDVRG